MKSSKSARYSADIQRPTSIRGEGDEPIEGKFYSANFSKTRLDDETTARIEKVLRTRKRKGVVEYFVKWVGRPAYLNRWIRQDQLVPTDE